MYVCNRIVGHIVCWWERNLPDPQLKAPSIPTNDVQAKQLKKKGPIMFLFLFNPTG